MQLEAEVVIAGGGPVGLTLAMWLADAGVSVVVVEQRAPRDVPPPKCNHLAARSMEIFRRLGVAADLRAAGLPDEHDHDIAFRTTMVGEDFGRIPIPGRAGRRRGDGGPDTWWPTPEPPHRVNQIYMEPILFDHAVRRDQVRVVNEAVVTGVSQNEDGVLLEARRPDGEECQVSGSYLVGCDGGRSTVRRCIGIDMVGDPVVQRVQSTLIEAPDLSNQLRSRPAWATVVLNPRRSGTAYAIDGEHRWLVHNYLRPDEADFDAVDRHGALSTILGGDVGYQILSREDWFGRRLIAERFRDRRIFLCGDAAHIWVPYGGYGLNAGVADAENLGWLLAAVCTGWGSEAMLDAYEAERLPITDQVSRHAMDHAEKMIRNREAIPADLEAPGASGQATRARYGRAMEELNVAQYCCAGLNFGYYYDRSPLIEADGVAPAYTMADYTPSTVPGCRTPHRWLADGTSLYDHLGTGYLMVGSPDALGRADVDAVVGVAERRGIPLDRIGVQDWGDEPLLITRADGHTAWRGAVVEQPEVLLDRLSGRGR